MLRSATKVMNSHAGDFLLYAESCSFLLQRSNIDQAHSCYCAVRADVLSLLEPWEVCSTKFCTNTVCYNRSSLGDVLVPSQQSSIEL